MGDSRCASARLKSINIALLPGPRDAGWVKGEVEGTLEAAHKAAIKVNIVDIRYGDSDRIGQAQLAAQLLAKHGKTLDYILGCTGCAPAALLPIKQAGLNKKIRVVSYDLTREIAGLIRKGEVVASVDTRGVSQARVVINAVVDFLEGRTNNQAHVIRRSRWIYTRPFLCAGEGQGRRKHSIPVPHEVRARRLG